MPAATKNAPPARAARFGWGWSGRPGKSGRSGRSEALGFSRPARPSDPPDPPDPPDLVNVLVSRRLAERAARPLHQIALDEDVDVAVEHAIHIAHLLLGPVILDQLIGMQDVAANLAAEPDFFLHPAD